MITAIRKRAGISGQNGVGAERDGSDGSKSGYTSPLRRTKESYALPAPFPVQNTFDPFDTV